MSDHSVSATPANEIDVLLRQFQRACEDVVVQGDSNLSATTKLRAVLRNDLRARLLARSSSPETPIVSAKEVQDLADAWFMGGCTPWRDGSAMHWSDATHFALLDAFFGRHDNIESDHASLPTATAETPTAFGEDAVRWEVYEIHDGKKPFLQTTTDEVHARDFYRWSRETYPDCDLALVRSTTHRERVP